MADILLAMVFGKRVRLTDDGSVSEINDSESRFT